MSAITHYGSVTLAQEAVQARVRSGSNACGWSETPHIVMHGGWLCSFCGNDTRDARSAERHTATGARLDDRGSWNRTGEWGTAASGWGWSDEDEKQRDEDLYDGLNFTCRCGDPSGWCEYGKGMFCMTCGGDVDTAEAVTRAEAALAEDPEWVDIPTPVGA